MKVLLLTDVQGLGSLGDEVTVKSGFARNYLLPRKKALGITADNLKLVNSYRKQLSEKRQQSIEENQQIADKINQLELTFIEKASGEGRLFGAVNDKKIFEELQKNGIELKDQGILKNPHIKQLGQYSIRIDLHSKVSADLKIKVISEAEKAEKTEDSQLTEVVAEENVEVKTADDGEENVAVAEEQPKQSEEAETKEDSA